MFETKRYDRKFIGTVFGAAILILILVANVGCGGLTGAKSATVSSVQVTPASATIQPGSTQQFSATVGGSLTSSVTWSTNGGNISSSGLFNAPSAPGTYVIQATSTADSSKVGSATVIVSGSSSGGSNPVSSTHTVSLNWAASTSNVVGYLVYRGTASGGPYTRLFASADPSTAYTDNSVQDGATYFYVVTAVDGNGAESGFSNQATATVPAS